VGSYAYPWGDYYPPKWDDGNYNIANDGGDDRSRVGRDGILGTAPVGSFKPNALGFYDLGGNVWEWMNDGHEEKTRLPVSRGGGHLAYKDFTLVSWRFSAGATRFAQTGFRVVRVSGAPAKSGAKTGP